MVKISRVMMTWLNTTNKTTNKQKNTEHKELFISLYTVFTIGDKIVKNFFFVEYICKLVTFRSLTNPTALEHLTSSIAPVDSL